jgi:hypothetical protein
MMRFVEANLAQRQYDRVKLHLTVMNSLFRNDPSVVPGSGDLEVFFDPLFILQLLDGFLIQNLRNPRGKLLTAGLYLTTFPTTISERSRLQKYT